MHAQVEALKERMAHARLQGTVAALEAQELNLLRAQERLDRALASLPNNPSANPTPGGAAAASSTAAFPGPPGAAARGAEDEETLSVLSVGSSVATELLLRREAGGRGGAGGAAVLVGEGGSVAASSEFATGARLHGGTARGQQRGVD